MTNSAHPEQTHYDVLVIGVGSMGAATCFYLAKQGVRVLGIEQFDIPHELGSHAGQSRLIRKAYFEHPDYVPLLERAYENWYELEALTGHQVYHKTGLLYVGQPDSDLMKGVQESAAKFQLHLDPLSDWQLAAAYPQFRVPEGYEALLEPDAGFITPEKAILLYVEQAIQHGATIRTKTKITGWQQTRKNIVVETDRGQYTADKIVLTAGAWAGKLLPGLASKLTVTRQVIGWVNPKNRAPFELGNFPCWVIADASKPSIYYGFPLLPTGTFGGPIGLKLGHHVQGVVSDPDAVDRKTDAAEEANLIQMLNQFLPDAYASTHVLKTCLYTNTPDENFILDFLPDTDNKILMAAGFSGHGFKFASVVGEIMADLALKGKSELPIGFLNVGRFL
ncbi:MAG: N-methyl-L-tryptophan oxidase [Saprospiraceae bacterium]|nr:N-methyl-L-tryptophan oxidase [Saprospiraceae bacterium]MDZ4702567.1 N-methyl-L-tryptophan oxidase [Saprospiraceae bacterium]